MRVTVLGTAASYAGAGQACAGHLVEADGTRILLDCGNGVLANLCAVIDPLTLRAIFISHSHPDHFCDLYAMQALLRYAPEGPAPPVDLYVPQGLFERLQTLLSGRGAIELAEAFHVHVLEARRPYEVGALSVTAHGVDHTMPSFAFSVVGEGAKLVYTGDTAPNSGVVQAARGADLLIAEATLPERYAGAAPHLAASQAGALAREAGVGELVLVHLWPTNDRNMVAQSAADAFGGTVTVAAEFDTFDVVAGRGAR